MLDIGYWMLDNVRSRLPTLKMGVRGLSAVGVAGVLGLTGCGKEGPPLPPQIQVAERTRDLSAFQEGSEAVLRWSYPQMTSAGQELPTIDAVEVWRATLPLGQEPPPPTTAQDRRMRQQMLSAEGELAMVLEGEALQAATRGPDLVVRDDLAAWRREALVIPQTPVIWYAVRTVCCRKRRSEFSNIARLEPQEPPAAPVGLSLAPGSGGITIQWQQKDGIGTIIERSPDGGSWTDPVGEVLSESQWLDAEAAQGRSWSYRLRSVLELDGGGRVVGEPSEPARVDHPDTYPPAAPTGIVCLPEGPRVRVRWSAVTDAAAYMVWRRDGGGEPSELAAALQAAELIDTSPPLGQLLYEVVAVDESGNRSPAASCSVTMGAVP
jgi:hypothetical protein